MDLESPASASRCALRLDEIYVGPRDDVGAGGIVEDQKFPRERRIRAGDGIGTASSGYLVAMNTRRIRAGDRIGTGLGNNAVGARFVQANVRPGYGIRAGIHRELMRPKGRGVGP